MTDLDINIALAKAMGWVDFNNQNSLDGAASRIIKSDGMLLAWDVDLFQWRLFDYRDPVIFVAICKRWELLVLHHASQVRCGYANEFNDTCIEKAAALCVIDAAKRGVK